MIDFVEDVARGAGRVLLEHFERLDARSFRTKSSYRDLVTAADMDSERYIIGRLRERYPAHAIHAEETLQERSETGPCWFVDPLDGTINFIHSLPCFGVSIALYEGPEPRLGVVYLPRLGELFRAESGGGCWKDGERVSVSRRESLRDAVVGTGFHYQRATLHHNNLANFNRVFGVAAGLRRMGAASMDLAYTACGRLDAFWELHLAPHDVAAGALLIREAGGVVTDAFGGEDWLFGKSIVCGPRSLHAELRALVEFGPEPGG
jgi:myo-inositol-1(or 4)-monophosphatase